MQLIVISSPGNIPNEAMIINQLFEAELDCFHLRKPDYPISTIEKLLMQIKPDFFSKIALHQFHCQAEDFGIKRLHYTEQARNLSDEFQWQTQKENGYVLSSSVHDRRSLQQIPAWFDYVFFSPVFDSISKKNYKSLLPEDFYLHQLDKPVPVVALGGIEAAKIEEVKKMNFDGAALLGTIWSNPQRAIDEFKKVKKKCKQAARMH